MKMPGRASIRGDYFVRRLIISILLLISAELYAFFFPAGGSISITQEPQALITVVSP